MVCILGGADLAGAINNVVTFGAGGHLCTNRNG
jgi:hypothetical protein